MIAPFTPVQTHTKLVVFASVRLVCIVLAAFRVSLTLLSEYTASAYHTACLEQDPKITYSYH
jgi:hypothetical protein